MLFEQKKHWKIGTDLAPAISMAYEGKESDIMNRPPRNPEKDNLVTWRLVSFSYLQIGMLQAVAGFYAYFVVLNAFGLIPGFLPWLDADGVFPRTTDSTIETNAYWLYCFNDNFDKECQYFPRFV